VLRCVAGYGETLMGRRFLVFLVLALGPAILPVFAQPQPSPSESPDPAPIFAVPEIQAGFRELYELRFGEARLRFAIWQGQHPEEPLGQVSIAASYLFEEFYRQGVLSSDFFLNDKRLLGGIEGKPDETRATNFTRANRRARELALQRLKLHPQDPGALYALTLTAGMESNFVSILEKHNLESLRWMKEADRYAKQLLVVQPDAQDAWLALGAADYIIGSLPAHKRFFLKFDGVHGDKKLGLEELRRAAENGHYLKPYARMLLGLAALREKQQEVAHQEFAALAMEFPENPLFAAELARLDHQPRVVLNVQ
jgi:hypothetical protein